MNVEINLVILRPKTTFWSGRLSGKMSHVKISENNTIDVYFMSG